MGHIVKHEEFDWLRPHLSRKEPTLEEAAAWATAELPGLVKRRTAKRLGLSPEETESLAGTEATGAPHWASYWSGTFAVSKRAAVGTSTSREIRGDPEAWWRQYDITTRAAWLKAYAAERLGLFEVVQVNTTPCERCGGTGQIDKSDMRRAWQERCPRCFGACEDRGVGYR